MTDIACRCLTHRGIRLFFLGVLAVLNFMHPVLHALHLEGGTLDTMLPYLNGYATMSATDI